MCLWCVCACVWCVAVCVLCVRPWVWCLSEGTQVSLSLRAGCLQVTSRWARGRAQPRAGPLQPLGPLALSPPACFCGASQGLVRRAGPAGHVGCRGDVQGRVLCYRCCTSSGVSAWGPGGLWAWWAAGHSLLGLARAGSPGDTAGTVNSAAVWSRARLASRRQHLPALCQPVGPLLTLQRAAGAMTPARDSPWWQQGTKPAARAGHRFLAWLQGSGTAGGLGWPKCRQRRPALISQWVPGLGRALSARCLLTLMRPPPNEVAVVPLS